MSFLMEYGIAVAITWLAFWQKNSFLYLAACVINLKFGLYFASEQTVGDTKWVMGVIITVIGLFCLFRVVVNELLPLGRKLLQGRKDA